MKLQKAIELNQESEKSLREHKFIDHADAIKLGIEAMKQVQFYRSIPDGKHHNLLSGETDE